KREQLHVLQREIVITGNASCACFSVQPVHKRLAQRMNASTRTGASFQHSHIVPQFGEFVSSNKPGHAGAQNEHSLRRAFAENSSRATRRRRCNQAGARSRNHAAPQKLAASYSQRTASLS